MGTGAAVEIYFFDCVSDELQLKKFFGLTKEECGQICAMDGDGDKRVSYDEFRAAGKPGAGFLEFERRMKNIGLGMSLMRRPAVLDDVSKTGICNILRTNWEDFDRFGEPVIKDPIQGVLLTFCSEAEVSVITRGVLNGTNRGLKMNIFENISIIALSERTALIEKKLGDSDEHVRRAATWQFQYAAEGKRAGLIEKALGNSVWNVRQAATWQIRYVAEAERAELMKKALGGSDGDVRWAATWQFQYAAEAERAGLIKKALGDSDVGVRRAAAEQIQYAAEAERAGLIKKALGDSDVGVRRAAAEQIQYAAEAERAGLIKKALGDSDEDVQWAAAEQIHYAAREKQFDLWQERSQERLGFFGYWWGVGKGL